VGIAVAFNLLTAANIPVLDDMRLTDYKPANDDGKRMS
jgi:hypothetical protein